MPVIHDLSDIDLERAKQKYARKLEEIRAEEDKRLNANLLSNVTSHLTKEMALSEKALQWISTWKDVFMDRNDSHLMDQYHEHANLTIQSPSLALHFSSEEGGRRIREW